MTETKMEREVAGVTGETVNEIRRRGFSLVVVPSRPPLTIDSDAVQQIDRPRRFRKHRHRPQRMAA